MKKQAVLTPLFQTEVEASNDFKRLQLDMSKNPIGDSRIESYNEICQHIDKLFQRYQPGTWAYDSRVLRRKHTLFSLPGCKRQIIHTDYDTNCEGKFCCGALLSDNLKNMHQQVVVKKGGWPCWGHSP